MKNLNWIEEKENLGKEILLDLYKNGMIKTWYRDNPKGWILKSGIWSPFYIQLRSLPSYPKLLKKVGYALGKLIREEVNHINKVMGIAMAGIPIAIAISLSNEISACYSRKLVADVPLSDFDEYIKRYGEHSIIEGGLKDGDLIGLIDDLVTRFDSKIEAINQLKIEVKIQNLKSIKYSDVIVLLDREQGAFDVAKKHNIKLHCLIPFKTKGELWLKEILSEKEFEIIFDYLKDAEKYQNQKIRSILKRIANEKAKN